MAPNTTGNLGTAFIYVNFLFLKLKNSTLVIEKNYYKFQRLFNQNFHNFLASLFSLKKTIKNLTNLFLTKLIKQNLTNLLFIAHLNLFYSYRFDYDNYFCD